MRIIFLNAWHGKVEQALTAYLRQNAESTDIFCFQEADDALRRICAQVLPGYSVYTDEKSLGDVNDFAQTTYVRDGLAVNSFGPVLKEAAETGLGLYVEIATSKGPLFVCNVHGISRPVDKLDTPGRLLQSTTLLDFFKDKERVVIGGDFNAFPETESIRMFRAKGYRDLINEYGITNTRNHYVWDRYPDTKQYYSDYAFLSPGVQGLEFTVPDNEISDHLPLELTVS